MHAVMHHEARLDESPHVKTTLSVGKSVTIQFGEQLTVWLRPSQAALLARDLTALLDDLAAA